ncbi:bifunctional DNA primase/polymerase [Ktedonospora formicarum]|uniref:DNA primase/polymerase bifunctional N-terminal domain-containing protein n=1 Tax=Ktedonospora formicarum TaxID=2778364 RepID=A0A8J3IBL3_9CHLR|nr:bifunctional DNA primase/polymerase [Ktedonospora formicarum]GHO50948.1 hypothetical protein KSX_91110 [Ktedonospora formicarum]
MLLTPPRTAVPAWADLTPSQIARDALERLGWSVFPLDAEKCPPQLGTCYPDGTPKRLGWKSLQTRHASPNEFQFWERSYTPPLWAIITGQISHLLVLDFDGEAGQATREALGLDPHVRTGSGGIHVYLEHPGWHVPTLNSKSTRELGERWPGLDIRADGGYAAFCGQSSSGPYVWLREPRPDALDCLPEDLRAFLGLLHPPQEPSLSEEGDMASGAETSLVTTSTLLAYALTRVREQQQGRNDTGFWLACQLRDNGYSLDEARVAMQQYVKQVPKTNTKGKEAPYTIEEARASLTSAYESKARDPWAPLDEAQPATGSSQGGGNGSGTVTTGTATPEEPDEPLPEIIINGTQLRERTDQAIEAIMQQECRKPSLFLQSSRMVRVSRDEMRRPVIAQMGIPEVKEVLTQTANYFRLRKVAGEDESYEKIPISPPRELAEQALARQTQAPYLPFPPLAAIVETPVIRPDGSILDTPGYDPVTTLCYAPVPGMGSCKVSLNPTTEEREAALALLWDTIGEFPYVSEADKANALGMLLTPILRPAIARHVPLALIDAPKQGTGKGLLSDVVSVIATGTSAAILTMSDSEEELQKAITSLLLEGSTIITIDNITGRLQSKHLDGVLTSTTWKGRILGQSKMTKVPHRATWLATGNNIKLGGDLARRCYRIRLDAKVSRPFMRKGFKHEDLLSWATEHRAELVEALLTLARAWFAAGNPRYSHLPALGTFTGWVNTVGGILEYAGVQGFLSNLEQLYQEADEVPAQWETFLRSWHNLFGDEGVTIKEVIARLSESEDMEAAGSAGSCENISLFDALPESLQTAMKEKPHSFSIRLGRALEKWIDARFGEENFRLEKQVNPHRKLGVWRVLREVAEVISVPYEENSGGEREYI